MSSPYQEFAKKARERFLEKQKKKASGAGGVCRFTVHAEYKMKQYGLSVQKVRGVIRNPRRREEGIVKHTVAVMQPVSSKIVNGKEVWKQEIWVMFQTQITKNQSTGQIDRQQEIMKEGKDSHYLLSANGGLKIISAWRYPGVSPKRSPIPEEILRELEEGDIL